MPECLYCQHVAPDTEQHCPQCAMPLPAQARRVRQQRLRRFQWFCVGLCLFCAVMIYWLPRTLP
ncbi:protein DnrP [Bordetella genomosp. 7]|uniref:Protein DnrP n=1 Tax=Bordetella genomosp. 7 TaxID=1416805 RepID=A0A261QWT9_9BORD|nr:protein DnrP [Bordetella genomosp. 7]